ncbi:MAG: hypothetical protein J6Z82_02075 [Schwartzia sp.]|nr:hypothetical protein [Schwartzia sp. (in: firmicutes)]
MQKRTLAKRIAAGLLTGLVSASLLAGCGGGGGKPSGGSGAANNPPKIEVPARAPVSTAPTMTFKFGETEAKVYELKGVDLKNIIRTNRLVMLGDDIFFHTDTKHYEDQLQHVNKVTVKNETISNLVDLGPSGDIHEMTTNGKIVVWQSNRKATEKDKLIIYDGKEPQVAGKWSGSPEGDPDSDNFYVLWGHELREQKLENGEWKIVKKLIEDYQKLGKDFEHAAFKPVCVNKGEIYIRYFIPKKDGEKGDTPMLAAFSKDGKLLRTYEGVKELPRGWAVTENYVIHTGSKGAFRVYEKQSGKLLGEATVDNLRPFVLWTAKGNDVILYDDRAKKLYRVDF